jgi:hypothetical protein
VTSFTPATTRGGLANGPSCGGEGKAALCQSEE